MTLLIFAPLTLAMTSSGVSWDWLCGLIMAVLLAILIGLLMAAIFGTNRVVNLKELKASVDQLHKQVHDLERTVKKLAERDPALSDQPAESADPADAEQKADTSDGSHVPPTQE